MAAFHKTSATFRPGSKTMPGAVYTSPAILAEEQMRIFSRQWLCVGRSERVARPGDFITRSIAGESLIIVRDRQATLHALFNICRHRGTRLCDQAEGHFSETIRCPYHAWTYATDGRLIGAPHMQDTPEFDKKDYPLHQAAVAEWEGFIFVNIGANPVPFETVWSPMIRRLARFDLARLKVGRQARYEVRSNWKLVFQNYSECLHCPTIHPELSCLMPYQSGANDLTEGPFLGGFMEITAGNDSVTASGKRCGRLVADLSESDQRRAYYYTLMPNLMLSLHPDYVNYYLVTPLAADRTLIESEWLFHPDSIGDPASNLDDAVAIWDLTNRQDWRITEESQAGITSGRYQPGPYSARESVPAAWDRCYQEMMEDG